MPEPRPGVTRLALRFAVTVGLFVGVALLARLPLGEASAESALRIALRTAHGRIQICRAPTAAEVGQLPVHMRPPETCTETALDYRLRVTIDGMLRLDRRVQPGGLRRTRPLAVEATLPTEPGRHRLALSFVPEPPATLADAERAELDQLPRIDFDAEVELAPGRILLFTLDGHGQPVLRSGD